MSDIWDPNEAENLRRLKPMQIVDKVEETLMSAVKSQLFADAPVGALCSGGVDSSLVMAMASRFHNNLAIFHANVVGPLSETTAASALAIHLRLDLHAVAVRDQDFIDKMPDVMEHYGHPFFSKHSSLPFLMVSREVRAHGVKAVLSGEGSDECFLGYDYLVPNFRKWIRHFPTWAVQNLSKRLKAWRRRNRSKLPSTHMTANDHDLILGLHHRFESDLEEADMWADIVTRNGSRIPARDLKALRAFGPNLRSLLHRNDMMGMAVGIESRYPFLDTSLVKLAVNMPYSCKVRLAPTMLEMDQLFLRDKWVLRQVAARYLPKELSERKKLGFPNDAYWRMQIGERFFEQSFVADGFGLSRSQMNFLLERGSYVLQLRLLHLEVWAHVCLHGLPKADLVRKLRENVTVRPTGDGQARTAA